MTVARWLLGASVAWSVGGRCMVARGGTDVAPSAPSISAGTVEVRADVVSLSGDIARGDGHVMAWLSGEQVIGERFVLDLARGVLVVEAGRWDRPEGTLAFRRAEIDLHGVTAAVVEGRFEAAGGTLRLTGAELGWVEDEGAGRVLRGADVTFSMCGCEPGPWSVQARRITARLDDVATFSGAWIRVCDVPLIPVPWGVVPLTDRRTGFLVPDVGWGRDGLQVSAPFFVAAGDRADLTIEPEWRWLRGARGLFEGRAALGPGQDAEVRAAGGWDAVERSARGAVDVEHAWNAGRLRTASDALWLSDDAYLADYGGDFLSRATPWAESRGVIAFGDGRLETDVFMSDVAIAQRPLSGVVSLAGRSAGPLAVSVGARTDLVAVEDTPYDGRAPLAPNARVVGDLSATSGRPVGPLRVETRLDGRVVRWRDEDPWGAGHAGLAVVGEGWTGLAGAGLLLHEVGFEADANGAATVRGLTPRPRLPDELLAPTWSVGPVLRSRWLSPAGVPISVELAAPWTPEGARPVARLRADKGAVGAWLRADRTVQASRVWWDDGVGRVGLSVVRSVVPSVADLPNGGMPPVSQASAASTLLVSSAAGAWTLPGPLSEWRAGWRGLYDLEGVRVLSQGPTLSYSSRCQCLSVNGSADWSADRPVPDVGLSVALH